MSIYASIILFYRVFKMRKVLFFSLILSVVPMVQAWAQSTTLNKAKYIATLKVISEHKMEDKSIVSEMDRLRQYSRFNQELSQMLNKLDNSKPNEAKNQKIMRILERAGKEIYNELK